MFEATIHIPDQQRELISSSIELGRLLETISQELQDLSPSEEIQVVIAKR